MIPSPIDLGPEEKEKEAEDTEKEKEAEDTEKEMCADTEKEMCAEETNNDTEEDVGATDVEVSQNRILTHQIFIISVVRISIMGSDMEYYFVLYVHNNGCLDIVSLTLVEHIQTKPRSRTRSRWPIQRSR